jgi:hypothetical protein
MKIKVDNQDFTGLVDDEDATPLEAKEEMWCCGIVCGRVQGRFQQADLN